MNDNFRFRLVFLVLLAALFSSCVTHKNLEYLSTESGKVGAMQFEYVIQIFPSRVVPMTRSAFSFVAVAAAL